MGRGSLRLLVVGGDTSAWVGLATSLGERSSQVSVPARTDLYALLAASTPFDVVVVVDDVTALDPLRAAGVERRTVLIADPHDRDTISRGIAAGVAAYVRRGSSAEHVVMAIRTVARGGVVYDDPASAALRAERDLDMTTTRALVSAMELKDPYTGGHSERVTALAMTLAAAADVPDLAAGTALEAAFMLHDVGKLGIPESILIKPGALTAVERRVLQTHVVLGEQIVAPLGFPDVVRKVVRHHHERWDGRGYPDGLTGYSIPVAARIFTIADVLDAMTSLRPYRMPLPFDDAIAHIVDGAGTQFDPALARLACDTFLGTGAEELEAGAVLGP